MTCTSERAAPSCSGCRTAGINPTARLWRANEILFFVASRHMPTRSSTDCPSGDQNQAQRRGLRDRREAAEQAVRFPARAGGEVDQVRASALTTVSNG